MFTNGKGVLNVCIRCLLIIKGVLSVCNRCLLMIKGVLNVCIRCLLIIKGVLKCLYSCTRAKFEKKFPKGLKIVVFVIDFYQSLAPDLLVLANFFKIFQHF